MVIGAGPVGLYLTFQLGLHGIQAHVIDALPAPGGQCAQLFADKPIYDMPGHSAQTGISGADLSANLFQQADLFQPHWHWQQLVQGLERVNTPEQAAPQQGQWLLTSDSGQQWLTPLVFLAAGIGAFLPRPLALPGLDGLVGLHYHPLPLDGLSALAEQDIVVHGGTDDAVAHALDLAHAAASLTAVGDGAPRITLHHRRDVLAVDAALQSRLQHAVQDGMLRFVAGPLQGVERDAQGQLSALHVLQADGQTLLLPAHVLVVLQGLQPQLGPIAQIASGSGLGLPLHRKLLQVNPTTMQPVADDGTNHQWPGLYAVGDLVHYPGKRKLMVSGFHEATQAAYAAVEWQSGAPVPTLTYTSSDTALHARIARRSQK